MGRDDEKGELGREFTLRMSSDIGVDLAVMVYRGELVGLDEEEGICG